MDEFGVKAFSSGLAVPGNLSRFLLLAASLLASSGRIVPSLPRWPHPPILT